MNRDAANGELCRGEGEAERVDLCEIENGKGGVKGRRVAEGVGGEGGW